MPYHLRRVLLTSRVPALSHKGKGNLAHTFSVKVYRNRTSCYLDKSKRSVDSEALNLDPSSLLQVICQPCRQDLSQTLAGNQNGSGDGVISSVGFKAKVVRPSPISLHAFTL